MFNPFKNLKIKVITTDNKLVKVIYFSLGIFFVVLGILGLIIPIMPGFIFFIPGAYFLAKASNRLHNWMKEHKHIGKYFHKHDN